MALTPYKTFAPGEILTATDLNASFSHLTTNALQMISPLTGTLDADGNIIVLDGDADSKIQCATDDVLTLTLQNFAAFIWDGDVASPVNGITFTSSATGVGPLISAHGETNVDLRLKGKGTGKISLLNEDSESLDISKNAADEVLLQAGGTDSNISLVLKGKGTGTIQLGDAELPFPDSDGTAGQSLVTNGAGALSWGYGIAPGFIAPYGGTGTPTGWLLCDGSNVNRTTYAALFAAIGETWGAGDGVTTFGLPDLRRRTLVGKGGSGTGTLGNAVGNTGGAETVTSSNHTHSAGTLAGSAGLSTVTCVAGGGNSVTPDHTTTITGSTGSAGSEVLNNMQPSAVVGYFIKT